ncbi:DUF6444 domain-containing protein [Aeromonas veronii]
MCALLLDHIAEQEDCLNLHSGNSSKPSSSDGPRACKRPASDRPQGVQHSQKGCAASCTHTTPGRLRSHIILPPILLAAGGHAYP